MTDPVNEAPQTAAQPGDVVAQGEQVPAPQDAPGTAVPGGGAGDDGAPEETRTQQFFREFLSGSWLVSALAIVVALFVGGVLIALADSRVQETAAYLFARPGDFFRAAWDTVYGAYRAMFRGAVYDFQADTFSRSVRPLTETLVFATPLILAGLGLAVGFRAALFNIGAQGQIVLGGIFGAFIGFTFDLPVVVHVTLAAIGAALGGAIWAGIAGVLKARTGANEVIVTIMLNNIAVYLIAYLLTTQAFRLPNSPFPKSPDVPSDSAAYPLLLGPSFRLHAGFLLAIAATVLVWWLLERSTIGFEIRAAGSNPSAARTAGISVNRVVVLTMVISGALCGLAGSAQVLGTERALTAGVAASYGFDAITVALLGRSRPFGTFVAGLLFGALRAGGVLMQSTTQTPIDIILVVQSIIVLLIAAPPLVRAIFRLPAPGARPRGARTPVAKEAAA
ncbi:nucleoside ABC transporter membrane protein [Georgenia soli]|uniref:Nucleoside ABC transporter membrane protein n=1 Tax=Georgenia soli TaxID=638953 RepID=A0A2A9EN92_9MICO|nr:ABC transporter permease [Georgenia soli]PFG40557.1 nucleoside ABC transporter membrane protein [Georgenia soli]